MDGNFPRGQYLFTRIKHFLLIKAAMHWEYIVEKSSLYNGLTGLQKKLCTKMVTGPCPKVNALSGRDQKRFLSCGMFFHIEFMRVCQDIFVFGNGL